MKKADNQLLVIFGASGDLTRRKLMPSLFELYVRGLLPKRFAILGASRSEYTDDTFRQQQREAEAQQRETARAEAKQKAAEYKRQIMPYLASKDWAGADRFAAEALAELSEDFHPIPL